MTRDHEVHFSFLVSATDDNNQEEEPESFDAAWNHPNPEKRKKWHEAIRLEFCQMLNTGVWRKQGKVNLPDRQKAIGMKWVFKIKNNGVY